IVLSAALLTMDFTVFGLDATSPLKGVRTVTIYVGIITAVIGLVVMVLGIRGHRTGGLHPFVWIAMVTAMALMIGCTALGVATAVSEHAARSYSTVELDGRATIGSTKADMEKLSKGVYVEGDDYDRDILTIDLTDYAKHHDIHKVELNDGTTGRSSCPTGPINIVARDAQVKVLLPLGCSWAIADDAGEGSVRSDYLDTVGGRGSLYLRANPFTITDNDFSFVTVTGDDIHTDVSIPPFVEVKGALDGNDGQGDADEDDAEEPDTDDGLTYSGEWFGNDRIERFCQGVATNAKGQVEIGTNAGAEAKQLIKDGGYWPCAVDASKAVETPELLIAPNMLLGATVSVEYPAIAKQ
ncbi:MAG: hypothetical protein UHD09_03655, partial [Bifidobacterium sp.]|nr:hypothetical protein [Bifidobacterium sp.]